MRNTAKIVIGILVIIFIAIVLQKLTVKPKPKTITLLKTDTLSKTSKTPKESTITKREQRFIQRPESSNQIDKSLIKSKISLEDTIKAISKLEPIEQTKIPIDTSKFSPEPAQMLMETLASEDSVTKHKLIAGDTELFEKPDIIQPDTIVTLPDTGMISESQQQEVPDSIASLIIGKESLWLIKPYQIRERIDDTSNQVYFEIWRDSTFLGIEKVVPISDYFLLSAKRNILTNTKAEGQRRQPETQQAFDRMGLIPDVELPRIPLFGEGSRINISGSDKITFGGRQTFTSGYTQTATSTRLLPELKMEQALRVNLEGTIGERTKVLIDHDSERDQLGKNQIKLTYTGTEDDILQNLEFGDTRLVIPGTGYTGDLPSRKGLFGISGKAKVGGLDLYAIASREESQGETKEFRGQTTVVSDTIYDTDFLRRTFFWIGETALGRISDLQVYVNDGVITNPNAEPAIASVFWQYPESIPRYYLYDRDSGRYALKVRGQDYIFHEESNIIEFTKNSPLPTNWRVGVSYIIGNDTVGGRRFIYHDTIPILIIKLILPQRSDTLSQCWNYELKNVYSLGARDIKIENIKILRYELSLEPINYPEIETDGQKSGQTFLRILGLDPDNNGTVEWPEFDASRGYIIFPTVFPFASESLSVPNRIIYRRDNLSYSEGRKYLIVTSYMTSKGSFALGQFDIEDGSEKVYVNGQLLSTEDYDINYLTGELKFIKPLPQNADVKVTYEYRPLFSLAQKSLVGTRGEWRFSENGRIGTSLFYRQEAMPETKATLGAEPFQRLIAETDVSYNYKPEIINTILQKIPLLRTSSPSSFSFASEGAISLPNPNTRGLTYLDDFEKTTLSQEVSMRGLLWQFSSVPSIKDTNTLANERIFWINPTTRIRKDSIFGTGIGEEGNETVDFLKIYYTPYDSASWAGLMTCVSQTGWNLRDIENLEIVFRPTHAVQQNGKIHFSIATRIDEDAPRRTKYGTIAGYNNLQDKEDRNNNGILDEGLFEDSGLDTIIGADNQDVTGDDGNDDYHATNNPVGTEGNRRLDDEDLDQNGYSRNNDYYEFSISLSDSVFFTPLSNNWKLLRVPLMDSIVMRDPSKFRIEGTPKWEDIRIVRVWFSNFVSPETIDVYSIAFVGSRWRNARVEKPDTITNPTQPVDSSEKVLVASISQKTDPNYVSPVEPRKDQTGRLEYEASLAMTYDEIKSGHIAIVTKSNLEREDYRDYQSVRLYVHNDINNPNFIFRFGGDSLNFYEYKASINSGTLVPGRDNFWYEYEIFLDTAVLVKSVKDTLKNLTVGSYCVYGFPSLADIRYQALAIENPSPMRISGSVWFGDIRLTNPRVEPGYGFQTSATFSLSDLASASFSFVYSDPNFRRFSEGRGVKTGGFGTNMGYAVRASLDRFFPASWGLSIPVSMRQTITRTLPKYSSKFSDLRIPKSDTLEKSAAYEEQWALNGLSKAKSRNVILNYTLEAISLSAGQRKTNSRTLLNTDTAFSRFGSIDYQIAPEIKISLFDNDISLFPNSIRAGMDFTDSRARPYTRRSLKDTFGLIRTDSTRTADVGLDIEYSPVDDLDFTYSNGSARDLFVPAGTPGLAKIGVVDLGVEMDNEENFGANYEIELFDIIKPRIEYDGQYTEDHPKIRGEYTEIRNFNNSSNIDISGEFNLPGVFEKIGDIAQGSAINKVMSGLAGIFQGVDLTYSKERSANFLSADKRPARLFRLGFGSYDTSIIRAQQVTRQFGDDFSASTGAQIKDISMNIRFGQAMDRNIYTYDINGNRTVTWPEIGLSISRIEKLLFGLATSSGLSTSYRLEQRHSGTIIGDSFSLVGKRQGMSKSFSPLVSWQVTWKSKLSSNISTNYSQSAEDVFLTNGVATAKTTQSGANASLSYSFSAPNGIPIPFLRKVRLPSDLGLTWNLRYSKTISVNRDYLGQESPSRNDVNLGTDISASYRLSNSVESGLSTGYSEYNDKQRGRKTKNVDLNFWVLFKF